MIIVFNDNDGLEDFLYISQINWKCLKLVETIPAQMVDWKRIEIIAGQDAEAHIKKHGVSIPEVFNALNGRTYSRKIKAVGETRYAILGESQGRILIVILIQQSTQSFYLLTAYEPSDGYKKLYRERCKT